MRRPTLPSPGTLVAGGETGIYLRTASAPVADNAVKNVTLHGITVVGTSRGTTVTENTITGAGPSAVDTERSTGAVVERNEVDGWMVSRSLETVLAGIFQPLTIIWVIIVLLVCLSVMARARARAGGIRHPYEAQVPLASYSRGIVDRGELGPAPTPRPAHHPLPTTPERSENRDLGMTPQKKRTVISLVTAGAVVLAAAVALTLSLTMPGSDRDDSAPEPSTSEPETSEPSATPPSSPDGSAALAIECPAATVTVSTADQLHDALAAAQPGDVIALEDGVYSGLFVAATSGTADAPIWLCGAEAAVLDGGDVEGGYVVHLDAAQYWRLVGFTVQNGQKGVMADGTVGSIIHGLTVTKIGDEAIHLRRFSTDSTVSGNTISNTGLRREKIGEGIYVGTAESNWCNISDCEPDRSDRNTIIGNTISGTTAEAIDIKEGTTGGVVFGNSFDGATISAADSWIDVKGNDWLIENNTGVNSPKDGFQTHEILDDWGDRNIFRGNTATVNGPGVGFALTPEKQNVLECTNSATAADEGLSNADCVN